MNYILSSAALAATAVPAVAASQTGEADPVIPVIEHRLTSIEELAEKFRDDAMALDPRIEECWFGYDELADGPRDMRVMQVYFGRMDTPFLRPAQSRPVTITGLFDQWRGERPDRAGETDAQAAARFDRYADLQRKITSMRPRSVKEAAIQLIVETDDGDSDFRPQFLDRLRLIAQGL